MPPRRLLDPATTSRQFQPRGDDAPYRIWGRDLEPDAIQQLKNACRLPVAVSGALMPDAHVGYGLPIGGVLATHEAVVPAWSQLGTSGGGNHFVEFGRLTVLEESVGLPRGDYTRF
jgi:RNA-splicing ligase RtcB